MSDTVWRQGRGLFGFRLAVALLQGLALYALTSAAAMPVSWPADRPDLFAPLLLWAFFVPLVLLFGRGRIAWPALALWAAAVTVLVCVIGYHDATRGRVLMAGENPGGYFPWLDVWLALMGFVFVAHALAVDSISERKLLPSYARHFDTAWKQGVQLALSVLFVAIFWVILELGAELFHLLGMDFFHRLIRRRWFILPATTLALAVAVHVTDVEPDLLRGARSLALTLFTWLLPVLVFIVAGFLCVLPFGSVHLLWATHFATSLLLTVMALMILLINAAYQDGAAEKTRRVVLRVAGSLGALELAPLALLAVWALWLRVGQYGWSVERVLAASVALVACLYAAGYAVAAVRSPAWLRGIEPANVVAAYVILAVVLALFTPMADPARLMVASQMERLRNGTVAPDKFDFVALKFDGARWGMAALQDLSEASGSDAARLMAQNAKAALAAPYRFGANLPDGRHVPTGPEILSGFTVLPAGHAVPAAFAEAAFWRDNFVGPTQCPDRKETPARPAGGSGCVIRFVALRNGDPEAAIIEGQWQAFVFEPDAAGQWHKTGYLARPDCRNGFRRPPDLTGGVAPVAPAAPDLLLGTERVVIVPQGGC